MTDPIDAGIQRSFDDTISALNSITNQNRVQNAKDEVKKLRQKIVTVNPPGKAAAVAKLTGAEDKVVFPTDGVTLGLVNEAHAILVAA